MHVKMSSAICFNLDQSRFLSSGKGLTYYSLKQILLLNRMKVFIRTFNNLIFSSLVYITNNPCDKRKNYLSLPQFLLITTPYFRLSPLLKHVRKVVGGFGKKSCVSTGVRKPGNTCASLTAMI